MQLTRMDLDGPGSPEGLVALILKLEKDFPCPTPIEALCAQLDITKIERLESSGFEGALITDQTRSQGIVLVNGKALQVRQRFTIAHELGHFLIPMHMPDAEGRFVCSREDMARLTAKEGDRRARMEVEANRFAGLILIPPPLLRAQKALRSVPDLQHVPQLARVFDVSKEAMARAYSTYHPEPVAILVTHQGRMVRAYRDTTRFPFIHVGANAPIPSSSLYFSPKLDQGVASEARECDPELWLSPMRDRRILTLTEQVMPQRDQWGLLMLHATLSDEEEDQEEQGLTDRWTPRF
ncbi:ImmA/IrrE family metallo-endopeptidase [Xanthobacter wiegelii]|uniref:ImmA/IrrE family metallo-endopeptidase n=1 Tax=Xanthobacter wiegelii TaxID=3119913 RepID=UPI00372BEA4E